MGVKIIDNLYKFVEKNATAMDRALNRAAVDVERQAKATVPVSPSGGHLKASGFHQRTGLMKYVVVFDKEYAAYQEFGKRRDGSRVVRHYSTPGTGKNYLRGAGDKISKRIVEYFKEEARTVKV